MRKWGREREGAKATYFTILNTLMVKCYPVHKHANTNIVHFAAKLNAIMLPAMMPRHCAIWGPSTETKLLDCILKQTITKMLHHFVLLTVLLN